jgi:hypothetical protein
VTPDAVVETAVQRGERPDQREVRGSGARERQRLEDRPLAVPRLLGHGADDRVDQCLVSRHVAVRAVGPEARDRAVHEAGVQRVQGGVVEAQTFGPAGFPALDEHVGAPGERHQLVTVRVVLEVEHHAALSAVVDGHRGRRVASTRIAARRLDPDDVGAEVGEESRGLRAGRAQ